MKTSLRRRFAALLGSAMLAGSLLGLVAAPVALGATDPGCTALGGNDGGGTCIVGPGVVPVSGTVTVGEPLVLQNGAHLDATGTQPGGFTLNVTGDMTMETGSIIEGDDDGLVDNNLGTDGGSPLKINVTGDLVLQKGTRISSDNNLNHGPGGNITINAANVTLLGTTPGSDNCGYPLPDPALGAVISSRADDNGTIGGIIEINAGNYPDTDNPQGELITERCSRIDVGANRGSAGEIILTAGRFMDLDGLVLSEGFESGQSPSQPRGGGPITALSGCELIVTDSGVISSKGQDPGADLVLIKACDVTIYGVVQSTVVPGGGHALPDSPPNRCNDDPVAHPPGDAAGFTACVAIIGQSIVIDATGAHNGNVNVDGIVAKRGWIDILSVLDTTIKGEPAPAPKWAVSAQAAASDDSFGGVVTIKSRDGKIETSGQAVLQANAGFGSQGGIVTFHAGGPGAGGAGDVALDGSYIEALTTANNTGSKGGTILVKSSNGAVTSGGDASGHINASGGATAGSIRLEDCVVGNQYLGTVTPAATIVDNDCGDAVDLPQYADDLIATNEEVWEACDTEESGQKSGFKFNDLNGDGDLDPGEPGLGGWPINLLDTSNVLIPDGTAVADSSIVTEADGSYVFVISTPGTYRVCEGAGPAGYFQTSPNGATVNPNPGKETIINTCPGPNIWGYEITVADGDNLRFNDFGNTTIVECQKETVNSVMDATYVGNKGPDVTVRTWLGESVQKGVDTASDTNTDNFIIVMVIAKPDGSLGGTANQKVAISQDYGETKPFGLFGCSVTLTGGGSDPSVWVKNTANAKNIPINGRSADIFVMDLHGANSTAAGVQTDDTYTYLRNEYGTNSAVGIKVNGNSNTVHNGKAEGNSGDGVQINGSSNYLTDTNAMDNDGHGISVTGDSNQILKPDVGEKGLGNGLDGVHVVGNSNKLSEVDAFANGGDGIDVAGNTNQILKSRSGEKGKGNVGAGFRVAGASNVLTEDTARANTGDGFVVGGGAGNKLTKALSNTGASGGDLENGGFEFRFLNAIVNGGGNKEDNVNFATTAIGAYE